MSFTNHPSYIFRFLALCLLFSSSVVYSHNNPKFENKLITSIEVNAADSSSPSFTISPITKETIRIVWSVKSNDKANIIFSVKQGDEIIAKDLKDGGEINPNLINGDELTITNVQGSESVFKLDISSRVIVKKKKKETIDTSAGKRVYKKANCVGCHKWHGKGGGGYGGAALSLRTTGLDAKWFKYVIRCGRPATGMPYHGRNAYKSGDTSCYETTAEELGKDLPPRARSLLNERQLDAVTDYVMHVIKGSGEPNLEQCVAYWGEKSRQCDTFRKD